MGGVHYQTTIFRKSLRSIWCCAFVGASELSFLCVCSSVKCLYGGLKALMLSICFRIHGGFRAGPEPSCLCVELHLQVCFCTHFRQQFVHAEHMLSFATDWS